MQISSRASFPEGEIVVTRNPYKANWQAMQARGTCIEDLFIYWHNWSCHRFVTIMQVPRGWTVRFQLEENFGQFFGVAAHKADVRRHSFSGDQ